MEFFDRVKEKKTAYSISLGLAVSMVLANLALVPLYCYRIIGNTYLRQ